MTDDVVVDTWQRLPWLMFGEDLPRVGEVLELHEAGVPIGKFIVTGHDGYTEQVVLKRRKD